MSRSVYEGINRVIVTNPTHFISLEGAKHYCIPTFTTKDCNDKDIEVAAYEGQYYLMQKTIKPYPEPIKWAESGKD